jgi:PAS domain S-box-containing protein
VALRYLNSDGIERLHGPFRFLLGCAMAASAVGLTSSIGPLRAFPFLLAFPTVVLGAWFLGMAGAAGCALTDAMLVDSFLTKSQLRFSTGNAPQLVRLVVFLGVSLLLGWAIRRLSEQREQLRNHELQQKLALAEVQRELAEERATAIEALRDRDEALQLALRANGMGLWAWDLEHDTTRWSEEVYRIIGRDPKDTPACAESWFQNIHPDEAPGVREAVAQTQNSGKDYHRQYRVLRPDGSVRWVESQGKCLCNAEGKVIRVVGVLSDVTHRKQTEEAMLRAEKLAVAGRLAASVAHEINNPLEAVVNMLYLITKVESAEAAQKQASDALDELMRVSLVTQSTLKFHRQTGMPKLTVLSEVLEAVLALFRGKLQAMDIDVGLQAGKEVPIACMPSETQQIFANLVANAIEAMQRHGRLIIRLRTSHDWRDRTISGMRLTVCDSGAGMDRSTRRRIFEPFFTTKTETGTGLGLWVVAQLVERHNGRVRVWSSQRPGASGTTFSVFLPVGDPTLTSEISEDAEAVLARGPQRQEPEKALPGLFLGSRGA